MAVVLETLESFLLLESVFPLTLDESFTSGFCILVPPLLFLRKQSLIMWPFFPQWWHLKGNLPSLAILPVSAAADDSLPRH